MTRSVRNGLACQKIESWDKSNWDLLAKSACYLDENDSVDGVYDLLVMDLDRYVVELDVVSGVGRSFDRLSRAVEENEDLLYVSAHINTWDIPRKFRYIGDIDGSVYYSSEDAEKISSPASQEMIDAVFGYNPVEELERIDEAQCSEL